MNEKVKTRIHYLILINVCALIAWYFWSTVRPKIIYATCTDMAQRTTSARSRFDIDFDPDVEYTSERDNCLVEAQK